MPCRASSQYIFQQEKYLPEKCKTTNQFMEYLLFEKAAFMLVI